MALKLQLNQPVQLALTRSDGKEYKHEGKAPSYMYSVVLPDGTENKIFLTPIAAQTLLDLRIQPREWFTLCRRKTPAGVEFFDVQTSANTARTLSPVPIPAPVAAAAPTVQPQPIPPQRAIASTTTAASSLMGSALIAAIDAVKQAEEYARANGIPVEFGPEDLRAIANTIFISASRDPASLFSSSRVA